MKTTINPIALQLLMSLNNNNGTNNNNTNTKPVPHHTEADPIKNEQDIITAEQWFLNQEQRYRNSKYNIRNYALFVISINCGRRVSDVRNFQIKDFVNPNGTYKDYLTIKEKKTGKIANIYINQGIKNALDKYLPTLPPLSTLDDYLFQSRSKKRQDKEPDPRLSEHQINNIYQKMAKEIGLTDRGLHISSHSTRKTAVYRMIQSNPTDIRTLINVQKFCNHSDFSTTLRYAGIQQDEIDDLTKAISI